MPGYSIDISQRNPILFDPVELKKATLSSRMQIDKDLAKNFNNFVEQNPGLTTTGAVIAFNGEKNPQSQEVQEIEKMIAEEKANVIPNALDQGGADNVVKMGSRLLIDVLFTLGEAVPNAIALLQTQGPDFLKPENLSGLKFRGPKNEVDSFGDAMEAIFAPTLLGSKIKRWQETGEWTGGTGYWFSDFTDDFNIYQEQLRRDTFGYVTDEFGNETYYSPGVALGSAMNDLYKTSGIESGAFITARGMTDMGAMMLPGGVPGALYKTAKYTIGAGSATLKGAKKLAVARADRKIAAEKLAAAKGIPLAKAMAEIRQGNKIGVIDESDPDIIAYRQDSTIEDKEGLEETIADAYIENKNLVENGTPFGSEVEDLFQNVPGGQVEDLFENVPVRLPNKSSKIDLQNRSYQKTEVQELAPKKIEVRDKKNKANEKIKNSEKEVKIVKDTLNKHSAAKQQKAAVTRGTKTKPKEAVPEPTTPFGKPTEINETELFNQLDARNKDPRVVVSDILRYAETPSAGLKWIASEKIFKSLRGDLIFIGNTSVGSDFFRLIHHPNFNEEVLDVAKKHNFGGLLQKAQRDKINKYAKKVLANKKKGIQEEEVPTYLKNSSAEYEEAARATRFNESKQRNTGEPLEPEEAIVSKVVEEPETSQNFVEDIAEIFDGDISKVQSKIDELVDNEPLSTFEKMLDEGTMLNQPEVGSVIFKRLATRNDLTDKQIAKLWQYAKTATKNEEEFAEIGAMLLKHPKIKLVKTVINSEGEEVLAQNTFTKIFDEILDVYSNNPGLYHGLENLAHNTNLHPEQVERLFETVRKSIIAQNRELAKTVKKEFLPIDPDAIPAARESLRGIGVDESGIKAAASPVSVTKLDNARQNFAYEMLSVLTARQDLPDSFWIKFLDSQLYRRPEFQMAFAMNKLQIDNVMFTLGKRGGKYSQVIGRLDEVRGKFIDSDGNPIAVKNITEPRDAKDQIMEALAYIPKETLAKPSEVKELIEKTLGYTLTVRALKPLIDTVKRIDAYEVAKGKTFDVIKDEVAPKPQKVKNTKAQETKLQNSFADAVNDVPVKKVSDDAVKAIEEPTEEISQEIAAALPDVNSKVAGQISRTVGLRNVDWRLTQDETANLELTDWYNYNPDADEATLIEIINEADNFNSMFAIAINSTPNVKAAFYNRFAAQYPKEMALFNPALTRQELSDEFFDIVKLGEYKQNVSKRGTDLVLTITHPNFNGKILIDNLSSLGSDVTPLLNDALPVLVANGKLNAKQAIKIINQTETLLTDLYLVARKTNNQQGLRLAPEQFSQFNKVMGKLIDHALENNFTIQPSELSNLSADNLSKLVDIDIFNLGDAATAPLRRNALPGHAPYSLVATTMRRARNKDSFLNHPAVVKRYYEDPEGFQAELFFSGTTNKQGEELVEAIENAKISPREAYELTQHGTPLNIVDAGDQARSFADNMAKAINEAPIVPETNVPTADIEYGFSVRAKDFEVVVNGKSDIADTGYMIARPFNGIAVDVNSQEDVIRAFTEFYEKNADILNNEQEDVFVGGWLENGLLKIDLVDKVENYNIAKQIAEARDQLAIWKINDYTYSKDGKTIDFAGKEISIEGTTGGANARPGSERSPKELYGDEVSVRSADDTVGEDIPEGKRTAEEVEGQRETVSEDPATGKPNVRSPEERNVSADSEAVQPAAATKPGEVKLKPAGAPLPESLRVERTPREIIAEALSRGDETPEQILEDIDIEELLEKVYLNPREIEILEIDAAQKTINNARGNLTEQEFVDTFNAREVRATKVIEENKTVVDEAVEEEKLLNQGSANATGKIDETINNLSDEEIAVLNSVEGHVGADGQIKFADTQQKLVDMFDKYPMKQVLTGISKMGSIRDIDTITNRQLPADMLKRLADAKTTEEVREIFVEAVATGTVRRDTITALNPRTAAAVGAFEKGTTATKATAQSTRDGDQFVQDVLDEVYGENVNKALRAYRFATVSKSPYRHVNVQINDGVAVARLFQDTLEWGLRYHKQRVSVKGRKAQLDMQRAVDDMVEKMYRAETPEERIRIRRDAAAELFGRFLKGTGLSDEQYEKMIKLYNQVTREVDFEEGKLSNYQAAMREEDMLASDSVNPSIPLRSNQLTEQWTMFDPRELRRTTSNIGAAFIKYGDTMPPQVFQSIRDVIDTGWRVVHLARLAFTTRNVLLDISARSYAAGLPNVFTNPAEVFAMALSNPTGAAWRKFLNLFDPYQTDLDGNFLKQNSKNPDYEDVIHERPGYRWIDFGNSAMDPRDVVGLYRTSSSHNNRFVQVGPQSDYFDKGWAYNLSGHMGDPVMRELLLVQMGSPSRSLKTFMNKNNITDVQEGFTEYLLNSNSVAAKAWQDVLDAHRLSGESKETPTPRDVRRAQMAEQGSTKEGLRAMMFTESGSYANQLKRLTANYDDEVVAYIRAAIKDRIGNKATGAILDDITKELEPLLSKVRKKQGNTWESFTTSVRVGETAERQKINVFNRFADAMFKISGFAEKATGYDLAYRKFYLETVAELAPILKGSDRQKLIKYAEEIVNRKVVIAGKEVTPSRRAVKEAQKILDTIKANKDVDGALDFEFFKKAVDAAAANKTRNLYYKATEQSQMWLGARMFFPFGASWADGLQKIIRTPFNRKNVPSVVQAATFYQYLKDPRSSWIYEAFDVEEKPEGQGFIYKDPVSKQDSFIMPVGADLVEKALARAGYYATGGVIQPDDDLFTPQFTVNSFNMFTGQKQDISALFGQEKGSIVVAGPGTSFAIQMANGVLKNFQAYKQHLSWVDDYINPYKTSYEQTDLLADFTPSWLRKSLAGFAPDAYSGTIQPYYEGAYTYLFSTGQYIDENGLITPQQTSRLEEDAMALAQFDSIISSIFQFVSPGNFKQLWKTAGGPDEMQLLQSSLGLEMQKLSEELGDRSLAWEVLADKYGVNNLLAVTPKQTSLGYSSTDAYDALVANPELGELGPDVFAMLFPNDAYSPQLTRWYRSSQSGGERYSIQDRLNYFESIHYTIFRDRLERKMLQEGYTNKQISMALEMYKQDTYFGGDVARRPSSETEQLNKRFAQFDQIIDLPALENNSVARSVKEALKLREAAYEILNGRGTQGIGAQANEDVRVALEQEYLKLIEQNPDAEVAISRTFLYEVEE